MPEENRFRGKCRWFSAPKGYGFLSRPNAGDVFCHYSAIVCDGYKQLKEGDDVEFSVENGEKGKPQAANVKLIQAEEAKTAR